MNYGLLSIAIGILLGLISISIGIFSGLKAFQTGISKKLSKISDKIIAIHGTVEKAWDLILNTLPHLAQKGGTIEIQLQNLGKTTVEAKLAAEETKYIINIERSVLDEGMINKLTKETGFEEKEIQLVGAVPQIRIILPTKMIMYVPNTDSKICTEYIVSFLKWLDSDYIKSLAKIKDFENPILEEFSKNK